MYNVYNQYKRTDDEGTSYGSSVEKALHGKVVSETQHLRLNLLVARSIFDGRYEA